MTTIILSIFATLLAAISALVALWYVQDMPEAVDSSIQRVATLERQNLAKLEEYGFTDGTHPE